MTRTYIHTDVNIRVIGVLGTQMPFIHVFTYPYLLMSIPKPGCRIILSCNPAEAVRGANADAAPAQPESKANPNNLDVRTKRVRRVTTKVPENADNPADAKAAKRGGRGSGGGRGKRGRLGGKL